MAKPGITVALLGVAELTRALEQTDAGTRSEMARVVKSGTNRVEASAHRRVSKVSGELDASIRSEFSNDGMVGFVKAGYGKLLRRSRSITNDASGRYAKAREKHQRMRERFRKARTSKAAMSSLQMGIYGPVVERGDKRRNKPAKPFINPALAEQRSSIVRGFAEAPMKAGRSAGLKIA